MALARTLRTSFLALAAAACLVALVLVPHGPLAPHAHADGWTRVSLNGRVVPVSFNDGDSFRVRGGEFSGTQCRLTGFNTLESFGPAHQWGDWHPYELYINAKFATFNARRGSWHCFTEGEHDGYGRLLVECPDLVVDQIRRGFAHAYNPDDTPSRPEYLRAQDEAITARRGMWAHGVPAYVMTSIHSFDEDTSREWHYNRLISTRDGHTESYRHRETYGECDWVCNDEIVAEAAGTTRVARAMRSDPTLAPLLADQANLILEEYVARFARIGELPEYLVDPARGPVLAFLEGARTRGELPSTTTVRGSCMLYAAFDRRYGTDRASCLAGHGTLPPGVADVWHLGDHH